MMKKTYILGLLLMLLAAPAFGQYVTTPARAYDRFAPEAQERGFGPHTSEVVQMQDGQHPVEVFLFSKNNGHYPEFDLFQQYIAVVDYYTKALLYKSDITLSNERTLVIEDRNGDGCMEVYRKYFKDQQFKVDEYGEKLRVQWVYDSIEYKTK